MTDLKADSFSNTYSWVDGSYNGTIPMEQIAICSILKNENLYLREWVEYHKNLGFNHIILYDNNPMDGEYPHQVIGDYIMGGFVEVHNVRGYDMRFTKDGNTYGLQPTCYNKCLLENRNGYDWIAFIDIDEFITIHPNEPQNIHELFKKYPYNNFEQVIMSWYSIGDDDKLFYENRPIAERFKIHRIVNKEQEWCEFGINDHWVKSMVKTNIDTTTHTGFKLGNEHAITELKTCIEDGNEAPRWRGIFAIQEADNHNILYIRHYFSKSCMEFFGGRITRNLLDVDDNSYLKNIIYRYSKPNGWSNDRQKILDEFIRYIGTQEEIQLNK